MRLKNLPATLALTASLIGTGCSSQKPEPRTSIHSKDKIDDTSKKTREYVESILKNIPQDARCDEDPYTTGEYQITLQTSEKRSKRITIDCNNPFEGISGQLNTETCKLNKEYEYLVCRGGGYQVKIQNGYYNENYYQYDYDEAKPIISGNTILAIKPPHSHLCILSLNPETIDENLKKQQLEMALDFFVQGLKEGNIYNLYLTTKFFDECTKGQCKFLSRYQDKQNNPIYIAKGMSPKEIKKIFLQKLKEANLSPEQARKNLKIIEMLRSQKITKSMMTKDGKAVLFENDSNLATVFDTITNREVYKTLVQIVSNDEVLILDKNKSFSNLDDYIKYLFGENDSSNKSKGFIRTLNDLEIFINLQNGLGRRIGRRIGREETVFDFSVEEYKSQLIREGRTKELNIINTLYKECKDFNRASYSYDQNYCETKSHAELVVYYYILKKLVKDKDNNFTIHYVNGKSGVQILSGYKDGNLIKVIGIQYETVAFRTLTHYTTENLQDLFKKLKVPSESFTVINNKIVPKKPPTPPKPPKPPKPPRRYSTT